MRGARVLLLALVGGGFYLSEHLGNNVDRVPNVFAPARRRGPPTRHSALTFLLVGTDTRSDSPTTGANAKGADVRW